MSEEQIIVHKTEKPNSFEFGKLGSRFKIYFATEQEASEWLGSCKRLETKRTELFGDN